MKRLAFIFLFFLVLKSVATATIGTGGQVVRATVGSAAATSMTFTTSAFTAGNYVVMVMSSTQINSFRVVAGANEKDWIGGLVAYGYNGTGTTMTGIYLYKVITGGQTSVVISIPSGASFTAAAVLKEYSATNLVPDVWVPGATGNSATLTTSTTDTTNSANELIVVALGQRAQIATVASNAASWLSGTPPTPTNSFTVVEQSSTNINTSNSDRAVAFLERLVTSTGTYSTSVGSLFSNQWTAPIVTFKEVSQVVSRMSGE